LIKGKYLWEIEADRVVKDEEIFKTLLKNRHISDYESFFSMGKEKLHDPFLLNDMKKGVERINLAISNHEKIMIFGDYDCDGISSVALLYRSLTSKGALVGFDVPDRFNEGYGLNMRAVDDIINNGYTLVITVDNGITCIDEILRLNENGVDTIITDHHEPKEEVPEAYALIHPKLSPDYPFQEIAGVMVAYKLSVALLGNDLDDLIELAMLGTIADLMPLENENQAIVNLGIENIKNTKNIGLRKLIDFSSLDLVNVTAIAFKIAPKINSSGRLNKAKKAIELLITDDVRKANELILEIEKNHNLRKKLTEDAFLISDELVDPNDSVIVVASKDLHEGVIGICAQRLVEKYQKSTIVITIDEDDIAKGSARAFGDQNILEMLENNSEYLERYGGHSQACGLQLKPENIDPFRKSINKNVLKEKEPVLKADMEVYLPDIKTKTIKNIQDKSFFTATYVVKKMRVTNKQLLKDKHTKLTLEIDGYFFDAIDFNNPEFYYNLNIDDVIDICGGININSFRNRDSLQIFIKDIKCSHFQVYDFRKNTKGLDYLFENVYLLNDTVIIENSEYPVEIETRKTVCLLPKTKKYNLNELIDRVELGKIYRSLEKLHSFTKVELTQLKRMELVIDKAIEIFCELDLLTKENETYKFKGSKDKLELINSKTYQELLEKQKEINFIYQKDLQDIKNYLNNKMEEYNEIH
jgi:single-stranded-DNA-specific exonuclease